MAIKNTSGNRRGGNLGRKSKNTFTTKSGQTIRINRSLIDRIRAHRADNEQRKAERLAGMPKGRLQRVLFRMHPKRLYKYWFSREGGIMALKIAGIGLLASFLLIVGVFAYFRKDLPNITDVSGNNLGGSYQYYDRTGKILLWEDFDAVKRIPVPSEQISDNIKKATIAIEDKDFYRHSGFDLRGIMRAGISNAFGRGAKQGGSTITQQLVRLTQKGVGNQQTYTRKVKEVILAVELEREYNKDQILTGYLNNAPYGNIEYGVKAGAEDYFHKDPKNLTIDEAAFMAAIPQSPSVYSPYGPYFSAEGVMNRTRYIIDQMVEQGMIKREEAELAKKVNTLKKIHKQEPKYSGIKAPYFVLAARSEINAIYGADSANRGGWKIITSLDMNLQKIAEQAVKDNIPTINRYGADESAFIAEEVKTGQIVSLVGGVDFNNKDHGKINYAHDAYIPPGSTFKPYDYTALIEKTNTAGGGSVLYDSQGPLEGYPCTVKGLPPPRGKSNCLQDYDFRNPGPLTLRYSLGGSRNIPAVKANLIVGTDKVIDMVNKLMASRDYTENGRSSYNCYASGTDLSPGADIEQLQASKTQCYGASAIGDGAFLHLDDHVNGIASLSRLGLAIPRTYILKITDASNKTLAEYKQPKGEQVIRQDSAYIVTDMAADPNASYLPAGFYKFHRYNGWHFAIKTGTTNNGFDGLMASWSSKYATMAWVGHHTRNRELSGFMEYMTTPIIRTWMQKAHDRAGNPVNWTKPSGVQSLPAYVIRTHVGIGSVEPSSGTDLYPSWYKKPNNLNNSGKKIDIVSNKLATECTPARAIKDSTGALSNIFSVDIFVDKKTTDTTEKDDVHDCSDKKPTIQLSPSTYNCGNSSCSISATVSAGTHPLSSDRFKGTVNLIIDGKQIKSTTINSSGVVNFSYTPTFNGTKSLRVEVIDSVLYDASDSGSISATVTSGGEGETDTTPTTTSPSSGSTKSKANTIFSWSGGDGEYTIFVTCLDGGSHSGIHSTSYNPKDSDLNSGPCTWWVKDEDGDESAHITFTVI